jgi:DNA-binding transcriptional MerR regulator
MNKKYYQMRDVSRILDIPASTIRFWEDNFPQLKPSRSSGGHRAYDHSQLERLKYIKSLLKEEGLTIEGAKKRLSAEKKGRTGCTGDGEDVLEEVPPLSEGTSFKNIHFENTPFENTTFENTPFENTHAESVPLAASDSDALAGTVSGLKLINDVKKELLEILRILKSSDI